MSDTQDELLRAEGAIQELLRKHWPGPTWPPPSDLTVGLLKLIVQTALEHTQRCLERATHLMSRPFYEALDRLIQGSGSVPQIKKEDCTCLPTDPPCTKCGAHD